jgi:fatty-acid desaturase
MSDIKTNIAILTKYTYSVYFGITFVPLLAVFFSLVYLYNWTWVSSVVFLISYVIVYIYGINIFYHRYWCHHQFKTHPWITKFFTIAGSLAMIGGPTTYALAHRWHHAHSDDDKDPHSPVHGRWHAFIGWIFKVTPDSIPITVIKDFFTSKHQWVFVLERFKIVVPWITVVFVLMLSPAACLGMLAAMFLAHLIELYINAFLHDPVKKIAIDVHPIIGWLTAGGLTHKLHHDQAGKVTPNDPGYFFVQIIAKQ